MKYSLEVVAFFANPSPLPLRLVGLAELGNLGPGERHQGDGGGTRGRPTERDEEEEGDEFY